jgi:hypothetical protein
MPILIHHTDKRLKPPATRTAVHYRTVLSRSRLFEVQGKHMKNTNHTALLVVAALLITGGFAAASPPSPGPMPPPDNQKLAHDIFKEIVEVRSVHDVGTRGVADILARYLTAAGFTDGDIHVLAEEKYPNQVNVVVRLTGKGKGRPILWNGHMDVVEATSRLGTPPISIH